MMTNVIDFLYRLSGLGIRIWREGDKLKYSGAAELLNSEILDELSQRKPEIMEFLAASTSIMKNFQLSHFDKTQLNYPLSFSQQTLWDLSQTLNEFSLANRIAYNIPPFIAKLNGKLDKDIFEQSIREIVIRHEILRTSFPVIDGKPIQFVKDQTDFGDFFLYRSLLQTPEKEKTLVLHEIINSARQYIFDIEKGPLLQITLVQIDENSYVLILAIHHIIFDGWSLDIFLKELSTIYPAFLMGTLSPLSSPEFQYADFAICQRQWARLDLFVDDINYWKKELKNAEPILALPIDNPRPFIKDLKGHILGFNINHETKNKLLSLAHNSNSSLLMILLSTYAILLSHYAHTNDLIIGIPASNRAQAGTEAMIGYFSNSLPLRFKIDGESTFRQFLQQVRQLTLTAYSHQHLPIEIIVDELDIPKSLSHTPLFQVWFDLDSDHSKNLCIPGVNVEQEFTSDETAKFDLSLSIFDRGELLHGELEYSTSIFNEKTIRNLSNRYELLLGKIIENPDNQISALSILSNEEREFVLLTSHGQSIEVKSPKCIHELFEKQVARTPNTAAIVYENNWISYTDLNSKANRLAHYLQKKGVGPNIYVGICVKRSIEMIVCVLSVLKAGGVYVPLDPDYPPERLKLIAQESKLDFLIKQDNLVSEMDQLDIQRVNIDSDSSEIMLCDDSNVLSEVAHSDLAYILYTSGTTGIPKGVMIEHHSVVNFIESAITMFNLDSSDRVLQFSSINFDTAAEEIFPCLSCGATLVLHPDDMLSSVKNFIQSCFELELTVLDLPTSYWHVIVDELDELDIKWLSNLRLIIIGGERAVPEKVRTWQNRLGLSPTLMNSYGSTETPIIATIYTVNHLLSDNEELSIGKPISKVNTYILNQYLELLPPGVPGEIYIGGSEICRGYLNQEELNREKFVYFSAIKDVKERVFKTGDKARLLPDGNIEYLGRFDDQIKIRGFRVEPREVEHHLLAFSGVESAVVVGKVINGRNDLCAYITLDGEKIDSSTLRLYLRNFLPEYMIPRHFIFMEAIPTNANGKIDKFALPEPNQQSIYLKPETDLEHGLVEIWQNVLKVQNIGVNDDFFELGGDSLAIVQIKGKIREVFKKDISTAQLLRYSTIRALANQVENPDTQRVELIKDDAKLMQTPSHLSSDNLLKSYTNGYFRFTNDSLSMLIKSNKLPPIDAAALGYLPLSTFQGQDIAYKEYLENWLHNSPTILDVIQTDWGTLGTIFLPFTEADLFVDRKKLIDSCTEALILAHEVGARCVSLTGLLPAALEYGHALQNATMKIPDIPRITTGHATTIASICMTIEDVLHLTGRHLSRERVAFVGVGSIGKGILFLSLQNLPHPEEIILCDVFDKIDMLRQMEKEVIQKFGYKGKLRLVAARAKIPDDIYEATLVIGATNVADVLNIEMLQPGTIIIDDSAPHSFSVNNAINRLDRKNDILFTEGGALTSPVLFNTLTHIPQDKQKNIVLNEFTTRVDPTYIMGCVFSSLIPVHFPFFQPNLGLVSVNDASMHYDLLRNLGFRSAKYLHCDNYI